MFIMKRRQYRSRQGRSDRQYESDAKLLFFTVLVGVGAFTLYGIVELFKNLI